MITCSESTVTKTTDDIADNLAGTFAFLQRKPSQHVYRKEEYGKIGAKPRGKEWRMEGFAGRRGFTEVHLNSSGIVLLIRCSRRLALVETGAPQIQQFKTMCSSDPCGGHEERDANTKVQLSKINK